MESQGVIKKETKSLVNVHLHRISRHSEFQVLTKLSFKSGRIKKHSIVYIMIKNYQCMNRKNCLKLKPLNEIINAALEDR